MWCSRGCTAVTALLIAARGAQPQAIAPQSNGVECSRERWNAEQSDYPTMPPPAHGRIKVMFKELSETQHIFGPWVPTFLDPFWTHEVNPVTKHFLELRW